MVIGNGLIAKAFNSYIGNKDVVIFASGVSNSTTNKIEDFNREITLLKSTIEQFLNCVFVYFSTCSVHDNTQSSSPYVLHKLQAEGIVKQHAKVYFIFRVSNVVGNTTNPNTIFNYLVHCIKNDIHFYLWKNATRNLLDVSDLFLLVNYTLKNCEPIKEEINIANSNHYSVPYIVKSIENYLNRKANCTILEKGNTVFIDTDFVQVICKEMFINFKDDYILKMLEKYYQQ